MSIVTPVPNGPGLVVPDRPALAGDMVRHVGDPVALVVAETEAIARDAAELARASITQPRDPVTDVVAAAAPDAPQLWPQAPGNLALDWPGFGGGDRARIAEVFAGAAHVARVRLVNQRIVMAPMEPRGALARYDPETDRFILSCASQSAFVLRQNLAQTLGVAPERVRVLSGDVGGGFGMRATGYPEYPALLVAARQTGRPVRWLASRSEGFLTDNQARDTIIEAALALDEAGRFLALDIDVLANMGAYLTSHAAFIATANFARCLPCMYDIPQIGLRIRCLFSNTVPTGPYRGAGRPEANYCLERLVDAAARVSGIDRLQLRRQNLIPADRIPYKTPVGTTYDSGDFPQLYEDALERADVAHFKARAEASERAGRRRGLGVSCFLEIAGGQPGEGAAIEFPGQSRLLLAIGVQASGQGHRTLYRRLAAERLGIPVEQVDFEQGDSDDGVPSAGAVASRSTMSVGGAVAATIDAMIEKGRRVAAHAARSGRGRHRLSRRRVRDRRHRPPRRAVRAGRPRPRAGRRGRRPGKSRHAAHRRYPALVPERRACRRGRDRPRYRACDRWRATPRSTIAAGCCSRCWSKARCRAASPRASARRCWKAASTIRRAASCWPARSWTTRCRAPPTCRISRAGCGRCPPWRALHKNSSFWGAAQR